MTEGNYPKVDGDIYYASEANDAVSPKKSLIALYGLCKTIYPSTIINNIGLHYNPTCYNTDDQGAYSTTLTFPSPSLVKLKRASLLMFWDAWNTADNCDSTANFSSGGAGSFGSTGGYV